MRKAKIELERLDDMFEAVSSKMKLYVPVKDSGGASYRLWERGVPLYRGLNTTRSPKDFFFPQSEDLMKFKAEGKKLNVIDIREESEDFAVFGVRACDVRSFQVLDRVFLAEPADTYYKNRREHGVIFSLACTKPAETCFCTTFGIDPAEPYGDVECYMTSDSLILEARTERGDAVLGELSEVTEEYVGDETENQRSLIRERMKRLPLASLNTDKFGGDKTAALFDDPSWSALSGSCLGCGSCTYVCPTCQCYDIKDVNTPDGVVRYRCWDSCMYSEFTKMSAGQPRKTQLERFRQRFMHKLVYFPANNDGMFSCVGCGRCLARCPIHMNIVKVMKTLSGTGGGGEEK